MEMTMADPRDPAYRDPNYVADDRIDPVDPVVTPGVAPTTPVRAGYSRYYGGGWGWGGWGSGWDWGAPGVSFGFSYRSGGGRWRR